MSNLPKHKAIVDYWQTRVYEQVRYMPDLAALEYRITPNE